MKELQNFVYKHMDSLKHHKRYLAMLTALSMLVTFIVPLILIEPADSMTKQRLMLLNDISNMAMVSNLNGGQDGNNGYSKGQLSEVTLLIGEHNDSLNPTTDRIDWADGCTNATQVIEAAKREFFIGIASEFCLFLQEDFTPTDSDTEGRVAVGGNVEYKNKNNENSNYQIAAGDFQTGSTSNPTSLIKLKDQYLGLKNFAHLIMGGNTLLDIAPYGTTDKGATIVAENDDRYKRFVVPETFDIYANFHHEGQWANGNSVEYGKDSHSHAMGGNVSYITSDEEAQFYGKTGLIDFSSMYDWMRSQSEKLANKTPTGTTSDFVPASVNSSKKKVIFTGPGTNADDPTVYFTLPSWPSDLVEIEFVGIPEFTNEDGSTTYANMVVNCMDTGIVEIPQNPNRVIINGKRISKEAENEENNQKESELILYNFPLVGTDITNDPLAVNGELPKKHFDAGGDSWDEPYNFYINKNFNGTIFAPNALVVSEKGCEGHLSGALIAKSFTGGLEFGYRPYRGGTDILGSTAGYVVPFDKFVDDLNGNNSDNPRLAGATFEIRDEHENIVDTWTSTEETSYITFPTELDFAGGKNYTEDNKTVTHTYTISEKSAPEGYITTDKKYKVQITETVDLDYLLPVDNGTVPTRVTVNLELFEGENSIGSRTLTIRDGYDENQHVQRIIEVQNGGNKDYFILSIENGNITKIEKVEDSLSFESLLQQADAENISFNAVTPASIDILAEEAITVEPYPYAYTPENLLTDYNAFAFNELYHKNDVIGAMAAKNLMTGDSMGKAAKADSYFENLGVSEPKDQYGNSLGRSTLNYELDFMFKGDNSVDAGGNYKIYYQEKGDYVNVGDDDLDNLILISNSYIDFVKAKQDVLNWSTSKKYNEESGEIPEGSKLLSTDDIITIDGAQGIKIEIDNEHNNYIIPESLLSNVTGNYNPNQKIKICFTKSNDAPITAEELKTSGVVVTFQGDIKSNNGNESDPVHIIEFSSIKFKDSDGQYKQLANAFDNTDGKVNGDTQANLYGTKLLFNFPDLKWDDTNNVKLQVHDLAGHIVAPNAYVLYVGGDGGVIAENVWVGAEIHYYPYYVNTNRTGDDVPEKENREEVNNGDGTGNESGGSTGGGTNDDETNDDEEQQPTTPQFPPITDYSAIVTEITITDKKTPQKLTNSNYYYDPTSLMIMPLPDETPSFTNEYALVFKKQSDESTALAGATIELQSGTISNGEFKLSTTHDADSTPPWEWGNETNTYSIPLKKIQIKDLDADVVYRFYEAKAPDNYEIAKPIYFVKTDNTTIRYTDDETQLSDIDSWTPIEFSESNKSSNIITMTDYKIYGPEIKFSKVQNGSSTPLQGAEFVLYAVGGDTLVYPLNNGTKLTSDANGEIDFTKVFKANPDNCNSEYIKNGYLVPGEYYLKETKAPDKYEVPTDNMYFIVNEDYTVEAEKIEKPDAILITIKTKSDNNPNKIWYVCLDEKYLDNSSGASISNISSIEAKLKNSKQAKFYTNLSNDPLSTTFDSANKITKAELNGENTISKLEVQCVDWEDFQVEYVTITTADGTIYTSDTSSIGGTTPTAYTLSSEPQLSAGDAYYTIENVGSNTNGAFTTPPIELGSANANKKITKIKYFISNNNGAGLQLKVYNDDGSVKKDIQKDNINNGDEIDYSNEPEAKLNSSGKFGITAWNCTIDKVYVYLEGMESTGTCDLTVSTVKAYYIDGTNATAESINALTKKDNIIGLEVTLGGSGSGNIQINDAWRETGVTAGETVTFGETNYTPPAAETGNSTLISVKDGTTDTLLVGNNKAGATTNISVEKMWNDSENLYNIRPDSITVQLKQDNSNFGEPVTLNAANGWKHTWTGIPRLKDNSETETYKYSVVEISAPTGYTVSYGNNDGIDSGQITITNTLKTTNIPVEKKWKNSDGSTATPNVNTITVKLQKQNGSGYSDFLDKDGNPVTLVLSSDNNWVGEFTGIPEGEYQVVESVVPSGWNVKSKGYEGDKYVITNEQITGALKLTKIWQGDNPGQRPEYINIKIYRTTTPPTNNNNGSGGGTTGGDNNVDAIPPDNSKHETVTEDYARLLQYSLYFYDANMCGDEVTENSVYSWRNTNCHTYDGEYAGGFHDAGDHAMFGLPQGFTASTLGWTYNEYKTTFDSLGLTNHYQLIMKEFCDFFVKSTKMSNGSVSDLLLDKGDAGTDHSYWGSPEAQNQGQRGGLVWANSDNSGGNIAAEYAAALASYYLNFPNDTNSSTYLEYARALYNYSSVKTNPRSIYGIYEDNSITDEQAWAAAWLYLATNEEQYKNDCVNKLNSINFDKRGHFWGEPALGAAIIYTTRIDSTNTTIKNKVTNFLNDKCTGDSFQVLDGWGSARHNTLLQLTALTYDKYQETSSYKDWCKKQMAFLLGDNTINGNNNGVCFVTGFKDGDSDTNNDSYLPQHPHHRAASGYNDWNIFNDAKQNGTNTQYKYAHTLIGALVGGPNGNSYNDNIDDTVCNEVAIDYNAGLVGAAAALYSVYGTGHTVTEEVMVADGLEIKAGKTIYEEQAQAASVNIGELFSTSAMSFKRNAISVLADEPVIINGSEISDSQTYNLPDTVKNKKVEKIILNFSSTGGLELKLNDTTTVFNGNTSSTNVEIKPDGEIFRDLWNPNTTYVEMNKVTSMKVHWWNCNLVSVEFHLVQEGPSITITNAPTTALKIGATHQLSASGVDSIGWRSSSEKVSVDNGNVIINEYPENGKVTITAYDTTNQDTKAEVTIDVEALSLTPPSSNVVIGDKVVYNANYDGFTINSGTGYSVNEKEVTATNTGNYTVSATYAGSSATASLNVSALQITNLVTPLGVNATHTFGVNGDIEGHTFEWISSDPTVLSFDENVLGLATTHKSGNVKIKVIKDGQYASNEYDVAVQKGALSISVQPTQIRAGGTAELSATNNEGNEVEYSCNSDFITISGNTITAGNVEIQETVEITGTLGNEQPTCNLTIIPLPSITAPNGNTEEYILGIDQTLQLTASNILGTATWTSSNESVVAFEENVSGSNTIAIRSITNGESTITVTDTDGTTGTFKIFVKEIAVEPDIPEGLVMYKQVTLSAANLTQDGTWVITENLPLEDERGRKYYYYIEEVTDNGVVQGSGGKYIPISYSDNGFMLDENTVKEVSVTNKLTETIQGQLPSTGGSGVKTYYYFGGALMLLGIAGFTGLKRRERKRRKE